MSPVLVGKLTAAALHVSQAGVIHIDGSQDTCYIMWHLVEQWISRQASAILLSYSVAQTPILVARNNQFIYWDLQTNKLKRAVVAPRKPKHSFLQGPLEMSLIEVYIKVNLSNSLSLTANHSSDLSANNLHCWVWNHWLTVHLTVFSSAIWLRTQSNLLHYGLEEKHTQTVMFLSLWGHYIDSHSFLGDLP